MRRILTLLLACLTVVLSQAEGTRQVAPNGSIMIDGNATTDVAALHLDHPSYNRFASYDNPDTNFRLNIRILDPSNECIYLGFSNGHLNQTTPDPPQVAFEFRIKDPNGNVVFGPMTINPADANISNWSEAFMGPMEVNGPGGYPAIVVNTSDLMSAGWAVEGDYYIEFREQDGQPLLIDFWDITVVDCGGTFPEERKGRLWSYNWAFFAINDFGFPVRPFNGAFYVCAPDPDNADAAFVTRIDFNGSGFRPAAFNVAFNSFGSMNTGNVMQDRRSVENLNSTQSEYAIFLNDPIEFCATADPGSLDLLGVSRCSADDYCIKFVSTKEGQIDLLLDFDGPDSMYTPGTADLLIATMVESDQVDVATCLDWDGLDGLGNPIPDETGFQIPVIISYAQGVYHFPIYDAELMTDGFTIEAVRPPGSTPLLFYDDSEISTPSGSGEPDVQLTGCVLPCHRWTTFNDPNVPGFGNLNTINSWWFAQQILTQEVFVMPSYYECGIAGPDSYCGGDSAVLSLDAMAIPAGDPGLTIISTKWNGPGIAGPDDESSLLINAPGVYTMDLVWLTPLGDTCSNSCDFTIEELMSTSGSIDTVIGFGDTLYVNGESYTESGQYEQVLVGANGCDSILIITLTVPQTVVSWDLDSCRSRPSEGTNMDYTEFIPSYPDPQLDCGDISATVVFRENPEVNQHSCTPGLLGSIAMCVGALDAPGYDAGNEKSVVFEVTVSPTGDQSIALNRLSFFEKAPDMFDWIDGDSGPNNYPTLYGIRVLKDGTEIYREEDIPTTEPWTEEVYDFAGNDDFTTSTAAAYRFELLAYALVGNGAMVAAWDLDEISIQANCVQPDMGIVSGEVISYLGYAVPGVEVQVARDNTFTSVTTAMVDDNGWYANEEVLVGVDNYVRASKNDDLLDGVTVLDLLHMRKHMLGLEPFTEPQQFIAADVTRDNRLSSSDIVELRKVMLGIEPEFRNNESWRFGDASVELTMSDPWAFTDVIELPSFEGEAANVNFFGVKIGDVNDSYQTATHVSDRYTLQLEDRHVEAGEYVTVTLKGPSIAAIQMELETYGTQISAVRDAKGLIEPGHFSITDHGMRLVWTGSANSEVELYLDLQAQRSGMLSSMIGVSHEFSSEVATLDAISTTELELNFERNSASVIEALIAPNPVEDNCTVQIKSPVESSAQLLLYNSGGTEIYNADIELTKGITSIQLTNDQLGAAHGLVICRIQTSSEVIVERFIRL